MRYDTTEKTLQAKVVQMARLAGWKVTHQRGVPIRRKDGTVRHATPLTGDEGYPDLFLARDGIHLWVELKTEKGQASPAQIEWFDELVGTHSRLDDWRSRGEVPDGWADHRVGGWTPAADAGDWFRMVVLVRPRHFDWLVEQLQRRR